MPYVSFRADAGDSVGLKVWPARRGVTLQKPMQDLVKEHLTSVGPTRTTGLGEVVSILR